MVGDWNGDGVDTVGVFRNGTFYLRNSNTTGNADVAFSYGDPGDLPVVGDWTGDGVDTIGVYRNGIFYLRLSNTPGNADLVIPFGDPGDLPVVGDWNGSGSDTIGVFRNGTFYLRNSLSTGPADIVFSFGAAGGHPVMGHWTVPTGGWVRTSSGHTGPDPDGPGRGRLTGPVRHRHAPAGSIAGQDRPVTSAPFRSVDEVVDTLQRVDGRPTEDVVAALPHLLQTAQRLARDHPGDPELVVAGLVHDLATCLEPGCPDHAAAGAELVAPLFGPRVAELVGGHTEAKRYLVTVEPTYAGGLSDNSTFTLIGQGGTDGRRRTGGLRTAQRVRGAGGATPRRRPGQGAGAAPPSPPAWRTWLEQVAAAAASDGRLRTSALDAGRGAAGLQTDRRRRGGGADRRGARRAGSADGGRTGATRCWSSSTRGRCP